MGVKWAISKLLRRLAGYNEKACVWLTVKWFNDLQIDHAVILLCQTPFFKHEYLSDGQSSVLCLYTG